MTPWLWIATADGAEGLAKNNNFYKKAFLYKFMVPWLGEGILISEGTKERILKAYFDA